MIRLQRVGRKHEPVFRLVLTDSKNSPKSGKFLEILGSYDARKEENIDFKNDKIKHWISKGAKLSNTVHNILIERKVIDGKKINALPKKTPFISEKTEADSAKSSVEPKEKAMDAKEDVQPETLVETQVETPAEVAE